MSLRAGSILVELDLDNGKFRSRVVDTTGMLRKLERDLDTTAKSVKNVEHHFTSLGSRFRNLAITVASLKYTFGDLKDIIVAPTAAIMKASGEVERMTMLMTGLSKETDEVKRKAEGASNVKFVFDMAKTSPFEVNALSDAFVKFKAGGLDPTNGSLKTLVDSVARFGGSSEHLKRASVAIQQMAGKGVISMEELRQQLGEAVPSAMQAMATGTGMSMGELVKNISKGTVEATAALERMFAVLKFENDGSAARMMDTWLGQVEKLKTNWTLFLNEVGQSGGFFRAVTEHLKKINTFLESDEGRQWAYAIATGMKDALDAVTAFGKAVIKYWDLIKGATQLLIALWAGGKLIAGINAVKAAYGVFVTQYLGGVKAMYAAGQKQAADSIAASRAEVLANAKANADKIAQDSRAAAVQLNANRAKHAALSTEAASYRAKEMAAAKAEVAAVAKYGEYAGKIHAQRQREMRIAYGERAMAAERMAARIKAAEAGILSTLHTHTARLSMNTAAASTQLATLGNVAVASASRSAGAMGVLRGAVGLLGGPIGIVTTLLSFGATAWFMWGQKSDEATQRAKDGLEAVRDGYATLAQAQAMSQEILKLETEIADKRAKLSRWEKQTGGQVKGTATYKQVENEIADAERRLKEFSGNVGKAFEQGTESSLERSVQRTIQSTDTVLAKYKRDSDKLYYEELGALEKKHKAQKTSEEQAAKERSELMQKHATAYYKKEIEHLELHRANVAAKEKAATTDLAREAHARQKIALDARIAQAKENLRQGGVIGTETKLLGGKGAGDGAAGRRPILEFIESMKEGVAGLNAELNKEGTGTAAHLLKSLEGNEYTTGKNKATTAEIEEAKRLIAEQQGLKDRIGASGLLQKAEGMLSEFKTKAEGGSSAAQRLREEIYRLMGSTDNLDAIADLERARDATYDLDAAHAGEAAQKSEKIALDYKEKTAAIYRSLSNDKRAIMMEEVELEFKEKEKAILVRKLDDANQKVEMDALLEWKKARLEQANRELETPMQKMLREWQNVTGAMERATASWLDKAIDGLTEFVMTGKFNFRQFAASILEDLLKIQLRAMAVGILGGGVGGSSPDSGIVGAISGFMTNLFANGGIMTSGGSLPLKMYSNGGIANSPQLAVFGEGRMPEAYVPLPDGRSIPVSFKSGMGGAGASNVVINIAVSNGNEKSDSSGGTGDQQAFWKGLGDKVKGVVRQELVEQQRPGGVLYRR